MDNIQVIAVVILTGLPDRWTPGMDRWQFVVTKEEVLKYTLLVSIVFLGIVEIVYAQIEKI